MKSSRPVTGVPMGSGVTYTKGAERRIKRAKKAQEKRWARKSGRVVVKHAADLSAPERARYGL